MWPGRTTARRSAAVVLAVVLAGSCAFALNPSLDVSQYRHTTWSVDKGSLRGAVHSIAQTPDGFLWLGTEFGLVRFDGAKFVQWPIDQSLPATQIRSLLAGRDGTLWMGTARGLVSMKEGKGTPEVRRYSEFDGQTIFGLVEDGAGDVWAGGWSPGKSVLCAIRKGCAPFDVRNAGFGTMIGTAYRDRKENVWIGTPAGVWRWTPGQPQFFSVPGESGFDALSEDDDGTLLIVKGGAIQRLVNGHLEVLSRLPASTREFHIRRMLRDRDGALWIGTTGRGLVHIHQGRTEMFTRAEGLSGEDITALFEDRDGNIWLGSFNGLELFSDTPVQTYTERDGLWSARVVSVLASRDGSVWMRTLDGLSRLKNRAVTVYREFNGVLMPAAPGGTASAAPVNGFRQQGSGSLYEDAKGRIWVSTLSAISYLVDDHFVPVSGVPAGRVHSIAGDRAGNMWFAHQDLGLFRRQEDGTVQRTSWSQLGQSGFADALAGDPLNGGLWVGFFDGGMLYFKDGRILKSYTSADGLGKGRVNDFRIESDGTLWITTEGGLSRLKNGKLVTLTTKGGLPCDRTHWSIEDDFHFVWVYTACGLLRISRDDLDAWAAAIERNKNAPARIHPTVLDGSDGARIRANPGGFSPHVTKSSDGKLWFFPLEGLSSIDPGRFALDSRPPPARIETLKADRLIRSFTTDSKDRLVLPPLVRDLEVEYTALSLAAPEKLRFRYRLEGRDRDRDWTDAGSRRQAFYNDLPPGDYHFSVSASRSSGVWNAEAASLDFRVAAAYYQTRWFQATCLLAFVITLAMLYQFRLRQVARQFRMRVEERVSERTRIARDLHDTLLQSFQGVLLKFAALAFQIPDHDSAVREKLEAIVDEARLAVNEGRDAVQDLRSSTVLTNDLARAIGAIGEELATQADRPYPAFRLNAEGESRDLSPLVRNEIYRIAVESIRNSFAHSHAARVDVEIRYQDRRFRLLVRDDGKGIDPAILAAGGRAGHHGIPGMRERAAIVGGKLEVRSQPGSGTEIELSIPASYAYVRPPRGGLRRIVG